MLRALAAFGLCLALTGAALAQQAVVERPLDDPAAERRAVALHKQLRCLVCQNQSIAESNADLARDLRILVRERITAGDDDDAVIAFLVARYGEWVLLEPPFRRGTVLLWFGPVVLLLLGLVGVAVWLRRRPSVAEAPLSAAERGRLDALLEDEDAA